MPDLQLPPRGWQPYISYDLLSENIFMKKGRICRKSVSKAEHRAEARIDNSVSSSVLPSFSITSNMSYAMFLVESLGCVFLHPCFKSMAVVGFCKESYRL